MDEGNLFSNGVNQNVKINNWDIGRYLVHHFFPSAGNKDFQNQAHQRFVFDNIYRIRFRSVSMVNLWDIDKGNTYNISQRSYVDFNSFNCVNEDKVWIRPFLQRN